MNTYLTIMVTILVATQLIRIIQNGISLYRQGRDIKRNIEWIKDVEIGKDELEIRKCVFKMLYKKLVKELDEEVGKNAD